MNENDGGECTDRQNDDDGRDGRDDGERDHQRNTQNNTWLEPYQAEIFYDTTMLWEDRDEIYEPWRQDDFKRYAAKTWLDGGEDLTRTDLPVGDNPAVAWITGKDESECKDDWSRCGRRWTRGPKKGRRCHLPAGANTAHLGAGACHFHHGNRQFEACEGAWLMAHGFAQQLDINPWDALLLSVRIAAGKVAYIESVLGSANSDLELEGRVERMKDGELSILVHPDTGEPLGVGAYRNLAWWVEKGEFWHDRLTRCAKMAVDAGIAAWQVERVEAEAASIARVLNAVIDGLDGEITDDQAMKMRALMRSELLKIDDENNMNRVIEGVVKR